MKKFIFYTTLFFFSLFFFSANAQNVAIGIQGGISIPNLTSGSGDATPLSTGYGSRSGADFGINAEFKLSNLFSIQPQLEYSSQGGQKNGRQAYPTPTSADGYFQETNQPAPSYLYADYKSVAKFDYLMLPILAKFGWDIKHSPIRLFIDAGPFVDYLLSAHQVTSGTSESYTMNSDGSYSALPFPASSFDANSDIKSSLHNVNVGFEGNIGVQYKFGRNRIYIEGGGNYGLINIQKDAVDGSNNTGAATIEIGYSYWLGK
jgi:hypothetical protein